jgi:CHAT domain-containing protein
MLTKLQTVDLTGLDLSNLELVTLSGCDSDLERSDACGDPGVLAANLLAGGVRTIVGTLSGTEPRRANRFFRRFYQEMLAGERSADAFESAQSDARVHRPKFAEQGGFYLIGEAG